MTRLVRPKSAVFLALSLGLAIDAGAASSAAFQAKLHVPWKLLQTRAQDAIAGESISRDLSDRTITAAGLDWHLQGLHVDAKTPTAQATLGASEARFTFPAVSTALSIQKIYVDQTVTREINGVTLNIHIQASCGPLKMSQDAAQGALAFALDWTSGSPIVHLSSLELNWPSGSWSSGEIPCEGPLGMGDVLRQEILNQLKDASEFKPLLSSFLQDGVQPQLQAILDQVRQPITAKTGKGDLSFQIGALEVASTGILANIVSSDGAKNLGITQKTLESLPQDKPVMLGGLEMIEAVVENELGAREDYFTLDLQKVSAFRKLMSSRFLQFFVWQDLFNYKKSSPFFLRIHNPKSVTLSQSGTDGVLETSLDVNAVMQSYRDNTWWSYVVMHGSAKASIATSLTDGKLSYKTTLSSPEVSIGYGPEYLARFGKPSGLPKDRLRSSLSGSQKDLSGEMTFDDIALDSVGKFRATSMKWLTPKVFAITWTELKSSFLSEPKRETR